MNETKQWIKKLVDRDRLLFSLLIIGFTYELRHNIMITILDEHVLSSGKEISLLLNKNKHYTV